jgi:peptidoglycan/xylan/chitin deacetylase (PgdA/CDA1 family)
MYPPNFNLGVLFHLICRRIIILLAVPVIVGAYLAWPRSVSEIDACCQYSQITFAFDDGRSSVYTNAFPIMKKYELPGTAFVITGMVGNSSYMDISQLKDLQKAGWEIASHSVTHADLTARSLSDAEQELAGSKKWLEDNGFPAYSFASPFGNFNDATIALIKKYYQVHRASWPNGINNIPLSSYEDLYQLKVVSVEDNTTVAEVEAWVDKAIDERKWLILLFHNVGGSGQYNTSVADFEEIAKYVHDKGYNPLTLDDLLALLK